MKCFGFYTKMSRDNAASGLWCCVQSLFFMEDIWTRQRRKVYITKLTLGHFHSAFLRFLTKQPFTTTIRQSVSCEGWKQPLKNEQERTICVKTGTCTLNKNYKRAKKKSFIRHPRAFCSVGDAKYISDIFFLMTQRAFVTGGMFNATTPRFVYQLSEEKRQRADGQALARSGRDLQQNGVDRSDAVQLPTCRQNIHLQQNLNTGDLYSVVSILHPTSIYR